MVPRSYLLSLILLAVICVSATGAEIEKVYVIPFTHNDVGFDATPEQMAANSVKSIDDAIKYAEADPQYTWNIETFWQMQHWLDSGRKPEPLLKLLREGRFGINSAWICPHTSVMKPWALDQVFRIPVQWGKKQGLAMDWAMINDVPGHPPGLPKFLAENGIKYLALGTNQSLTKKLPDQISNTPFWWETLDLKHRVLVFICAESYTGAFTHYGIDPQTSLFFTRKKKTYPGTAPLDIMKQNMGEMLDMYRGKKYPYDAIMAMHAFDNWGAGNSKKLVPAAKLWNKNVGKPQIIISTPREFFLHIEKKYGDKLPVRRGGFGGQWDNMRCWIPTAMRAAYAQERILESQEKPDLKSTGKLLAFYGHTIGAGPCWPGHLTRKTTVEHNLQHLKLQDRWPRKKIAWEEGKEVKLPADREGEKFKNNHLYMIKVDGFKTERLPMPEGSWLVHRAERLKDGTLRLRHSIDRRKLPPERIRVMWTYHLTPAEAKSQVVIMGAAGPWVWRKDGLAGYSIPTWIAPKEFHIGTTVFRPKGPLLFGKPLGRPDILYSSGPEAVADRKVQGYGPRRNDV